MTDANFMTYMSLLESLEVPELPLRVGSKRTPERDVIEAICNRFGVPASCNTRSQMAEELAPRVSVEEFCTHLSFLIAPFAHMFREVYDFLAQHRSTASSSQTIEEIRLGRTRLPFDTRTFEMVERIQAEVIRTIWDVKTLESLYDPMYRVHHAASCPGKSSLFGDCPEDLKALCTQRVTVLKTDVRSILAVDEALSEQGTAKSDRLGPDLVGTLRGFLSRPATARPAEDCLHGQANGQTEEDLYTQVGLRMAQSIVDQARRALPERVELLHKFLQLPIWRKRSDLYEVWALVRLCNTVPEVPVVLRNVRQGRWHLPGNKQGGIDKPILYMKALRGDYLVYTGWLHPGPTGQKAMPDWLFCRQPGDIPEFIVECKCGESYRLARTLTDPMIKKYAPLLAPYGVALLLNYRPFIRSVKSTSPALPRNIRVIDHLAPDLTSTEEVYRSVVRDFFLRLGPGSLSSCSAMDIVIAFDATSSMEYYQPEVYDAVTDFLLELGDTGANIRVAAIAIGDHPEHGNSYLEQLQPFTRDLAAVAQFIRAVPESTGGRTQEEAYEDALRTLVTLPWRDGAQKRAILIGDAGPNSPGLCPDGIDWEQMVEHLSRKAVRVDTVYLPSTGEFIGFYRKVAARTGGKFHEVVPDTGLLNLLRSLVTTSSCVT